MVHKPFFNSPFSFSFQCIFTWLQFAWHPPYWREDHRQGYQSRSGESHVKVSRLKCLISEIEIPVATGVYLFGIYVCRNSYQGTYLLVHTKSTFITAGRNFCITKRITTYTSRYIIGHLYLQNINITIYYIIHNSVI